MTDSKRPDQAHRIIVEKFGGLTEAHRATGIPIHRIHYMLRKGVIPEGDRQTFLDAAAKSGIEHVPEDYIAHLRVPSAGDLETTG